MVQIPVRALDPKRFCVVDLDTGHVLGTNLALVDTEDMIGIEQQKIMSSPEVAHDIGTREGREITVEM